MKSGGSSVNELNATISLAGEMEIFMKRIIAMLLSAVLLVAVLPTAKADNILTEQAIKQIDSAIAGAEEWYDGYTEAFSNWDVIAFNASALSDERALTLTDDSAWTQKAALMIAAGDHSALSLHMIAYMAAGKNPDAAAGVLRKSPVDVIADTQKDSGEFGTGLIETIYAVIALENSRPSAYNRGAAKKYLISQQLKDGGYTLFGEIGDVDMTGMALYALSFFKEDSDADAAIDRAVDFLYGSLTENGGYVSMWSSTGAENSNSLSAALSGLIAAGGDRVFKSDKFPIMVQNLLSYIQDDGGFSYEATDDESNYFATYQALIALSDIKFNETSWTHRLLWNDKEEELLTQYTDKGNIIGWSKGYIASATQEGLFKGNANGTFNPDGLLTRAELGTVLARIAGLTGNGSGSYSDVNPEAWYAADYTAALGKGFLKAANGKARPDTPATRDDVAYAIAALCSLKSSGGYVRAVIDSGIMTGGTDGNFRAADSITRREAAKALLLASKNWRMK
jgi:type II secretory pathway pseudopilin PulG